MATNRYAANCAGCGTRVPPKGGTLRKVGRRWVVEHLSCEDGKNAVFEVRIGGNSFTRNRSGRCEDAPCCGCCTSTGAGRIKGLLAKDTPIAHETGSIGGVANDARLVTVPDGRRMVLVVFTRSSKTPPADRDRAIAETARTLHDHFTA